MANDLHCLRQWYLVKLETGCFTQGMGKTSRINKGSPYSNTWRGEAIPTGLTSKGLGQRPWAGSERTAGPLKPGSTEWIMETVGLLKPWNEGLDQVLMVSWTSGLTQTPTWSAGRLHAHGELCKGLGKCSYHELPLTKTEMQFHSPWKQQSVSRHSNVNSINSSNQTG